MQSFYEPKQEHLTKLNGPWCCSYSGGKDSTSLVTWIEWLRRAGWITVEKPQLVQSDTGVEDVGLQGISAEMMELLRKTGWECVVVKPLIHEKLYNRILGIGNIPIHPGVRRMRWCTRATKIDPMKRWQNEFSGGITLTGLRLGESSMRDGKIKNKGCSSGGECGIPDPSERTYSPIVHWSTCQVIDWLNGFAMQKKETSLIADLVSITRQLVEIYAIQIGQSGFTFDEGQVEPEVRASRFGCTGCPAIQAEAFAPKSSIKRYGAESPLGELYSVWYDARLNCSRLTGKKNNGQFGPIKMEVRKHLFSRVMDIQQRAGVVLITPEDDAFIRECWKKKVYPRGWGPEDENTPAPDDMPLFPLNTTLPRKRHAPKS